MIIGKALDLTLETHVIWMTIPNLLANALRNPITARFAFSVNQDIHKDTVEERRQKVIQYALRKRQQRRRVHDEEIELKTQINRNPIPPTSTEDWNFKTIND